eukprot:3718500-Prymnesium_polylepis.1
MTVLVLVVAAAVVTDVALAGARVVGRRCRGARRFAHRLLQRQQQAAQRLLRVVLPRRAEDGVA